MFTRGHYQSKIVCPSSIKLLCKSKMSLSLSLYGRARKSWPHNKPTLHGHSAWTGHLPLPRCQHTRGVDKSGGVLRGEGERKRSPAWTLAVEEEERRKKRSLAMCKSWPRQACKFNDSLRGAAVRFRRPRLNSIFQLSCRPVGEDDHH